MRTLAVNEFFVTLQGEASFAGTPAVFVRFQGCPVACPWCDTQYAARLDGATLDFAAVRAKQGPGAMPMWSPRRCWQPSGRPGRAMWC